MDRHLELQFWPEDAGVHRIVVFFVGIGSWYSANVSSFGHQKEPKFAGPDLTSALKVIGPVFLFGVT